jgi:carboxypeptidase Taq
MTAFDDLRAYQRQTETLKSISGLLSWDMETQMATGSSDKRGEQLAVVSGLVHDRNAAPQLRDLLDAARAEVAQTGDLRHLDLIQIEADAATRIPKDLAMELSRATVKANQAWAEARKTDTPSVFLPHLNTVVRLLRLRAEALRRDDDPVLYDALLRDYEPDAKSAMIDQMFAQLRPRLVDLRAAVMAAPAAPKLSGHFDKAAQVDLVNDLATRFGYDMARGRIDEAVHPFCEGSGSDVRVTTRYDEADPLNAIYSIIHEVGHAAYEQNVSPDYDLTIFGRGCSMGVHESQSRICENQIGRSREFTGWLYGRMRDAFGDIGVHSEDEFFRAVNRLATGYIRTEADEVHYNLHVMLRYDLEKAMIEGDLAVDDIEAAWNDRFFADFGVAVDRPSNGFLQDIHWCEGLIGYFPTYTLGNVYAGCLFDAMKRDVPSLSSDLSHGDISGASTWLRENIHVHGSAVPSVDVITKAYGAAPSDAPLLGYLEDKFRGFI